MLDGSDLTLNVVEDSAVKISNQFRYSVPLQISSGQRHQNFSCAVTDESPDTRISESRITDQWERPLFTREMGGEDKQ